MITQEMIDRINELYHKSQDAGLSEEVTDLGKKYGGV